MSETDLDLLARFTRHHAEDAFAELVRRHVDLVHSAALRQVRSPQLAEEVAQTTFVKLAHQAPQLAPDTILTAWLYQVTRREAIDVVRRESRRQLREQIAIEMNGMNAADADWTHIEPLLDEAMQALADPERTAVLLRYFENKSLREVGAALGTSDDAARKRVNRAVECLRDFLTQRGVTVGTGGLVVALSANAVQAAPASLVATISHAVALTGATVSVTAITSIANAIAMTTLQKALLTATLVVAVGTGIYEARQASALRSEVESLRQQTAEQLQQAERARDEALGRLSAVLAQLEQRHQDGAEVLRLRGEVARSRTDAAASALTKAGNATNPTETTALTWVNRVARLKLRLEQMPEAQIPEMQFLDEEDWLAVVKGRPLETDIEYRHALSALRNAGESKLVTMLQKAVREFGRGNDGQFPTDLAQLQPYFDSTVEAAVLDRWRITSRDAVPNVGVGDTIITQKAPPVDDVFDTRLVVGSGGGQGSTDYLSQASREAMQPVIAAYRAAHNGQWQTDFAQLQPYATTPEQQEALQKMILRNLPGR